MPGSEAAVPENVLDDILTLGTEEVEEDGLGESYDDSEEFAAPEDVEGDEGDTEPVETDESDEEVPEEEAEEAEEVEKGDEEVEGPVSGQDRVRALAVEAKRAQRFKPILQLLEEDPNLAREIVGRKLGLVPADRPQPAQPAQPVQPQRPSMTEPEKQAYWTKRFQEDFAGAMAEMMDLKLKGVQAQAAAQAEPTAVASFKSVVRSFKADLKAGSNADPQFEYYEPYFDALLQNADRTYVMSDPDTTLTALQDLAYGKWARDQKARAKKARASEPVARRREPRRSLAAGSGPRGGSRATPTRNLSDEERMLAERYGYDLVSPDEDEQESAWR